MSIVINNDFTLSMPCMEVFDKIVTFMENRDYDALKKYIDSNYEALVNGTQVKLEDERNRYERAV